MTQQANEGKKNNRNPAPSPDQQSSQGAAGPARPPAGYDKVTADKPQWKPKQVGRFPLHMELSFCEKMPDAEREVIDPETKQKKKVKEPWYTLNGVLVEAGKFVGREDKILDCAAGDEVMLPISGELKKEVYNKWVRHSKAGKVPRLWIVAEKEIELGGGQRMWTYDAHFQPFPEMRARQPNEPMYVNFGVRRKFGEMLPQNPQLPAAPAAAAPAAPVQQDFIDAPGEDITGLDF